MSFALLAACSDDDAGGDGVDGQAQSDSQTGDAHGAFGDCDERAQNECPGWRSIDQTIQDCLQDMWEEGPGESFSEHGATS